MKIPRKTIIPFLSLALLTSTDLVRNCTKARSQTPWGTLGKSTDGGNITGVSQNCSTNKTDLQITAIRSVQSTDAQIDQIVTPSMPGVTTTVQKTRTDITTITRAKSNHTVSITTTLTQDTTSTESSPPRGNEPGQLKGCNPPEVEALLSDQAKNPGAFWETKTSASFCIMAADPSLTPSIDMGHRFVVPTITSKTTTWTHTTSANSKTIPPLTGTVGTNASFTTVVSTADVTARERPGAA